MERFLLFGGGGVALFDIGTFAQVNSIADAANLEFNSPKWLTVIIVTVGLIFFSFTTVLGWNYYGEKCLQYLVGTKAILPYIILVTIGPFMPLELVFIIADIVNGLMAVPNLIGLIGLRKDIIE